MTKKERFCRIIESFVNEERKELLGSLFGDNSKIKIQNIIIMVSLTVAKIHPQKEWETPANSQRAF